MKRIAKLLLVGSLLVGSGLWADEEIEAVDVPVVVVPVIESIDMKYIMDFHISSQYKDFKIAMVTHDDMSQLEQYWMYSGDMTEEMKKKEKMIEVKSENLGLKCTNDKHFMSLLESKVKLFAIHNLLTAESEGKNVSDYKNQFLQVLLGLNGTNMGGLGDIKSLSKKVDELGMRTLITELLKYHQQIMENDKWKIQFDKILSASQEEYEEVFHEVFVRTEFKKSNNECYLTHAHFEQDRLSIMEFKSNMDSWLYSFWVRRYNEGSMEITKNFLELINKTH